MKKGLLLAVILGFFATANAQIGSLLNKAKQQIKDKANAKIDQHLDNGTTAGVNKADSAVTSAFSGSGKPAPAPGKTMAPVQSAAAQNAAVSVPAAGRDTSVSFKAFNNYDFIPGDKIIFEDNFADDDNGEFPAHWNLGKGQAVVKTTGNRKSFLLTDGNYAHVSPRIKSASYLTNPFTIEFDVYTTGGSNPHVYFYGSNDDAVAASNDLGHVNIEWSGVSVDSEPGKVNLDANYPAEIAGDNFMNKWHHVAMVYKNSQLKVYVDQYRILVVPNLGIEPHAIDVEGIGDATNPIILSNFRIANGGGMNMLGKKFTDAKIITHGINFDVDRATIRPESMGTLNMIAGVLKENPEVTFEVDGHTDATGTPAHNLTLSQQRADAVKVQLVGMGISPQRLTPKGMGDTKPISDNITIEGKANNRRVEFVKTNK